MCSRATFERQGPVHVGLGGRQLRVQRQAYVQGAVVDTSDNGGAGRTAEEISAAVGVDQFQCAGLDEAAQQARE